MRKYLLIVGLVALCYSSQSQAPAAYYSSAEGLSGSQLMVALHNIIDDHNVVSYTSLWTHFQSSDKKSNGKVWDMYSDVPGGTPPYEFSFGSDQCGNYSGEGDCYNREHSWPQSWFNSASPMTSDLFHLYPTDGYVNGQRGNYAYGEVGTATWTAENGSKKGNCTYPGFSGTVFEPIDEYKGDFARTYFYMSTRYYGEDSGWSNSDMTNKSTLLPWAKNLLMEWHIKDPVSAKEIARNNVVYGIQQNRNPYIDRPEFAIQIFSGDYPKPVLTQILADDTIMVGENYSLILSATDPYGNEVHFTGANLPGWLQLQDENGSTAQLSGHPAIADTGNHTIQISYSNPYSLPLQVSFTLTVIPGVGAGEISTESFRIYPNPIEDELFIEWSDPLMKGKLRVMDLSGKKVFEKDIHESGRIQTAHWAKGAYLISIQNDTSVYTQVLLKR